MSDVADEIQFLRLLEAKLTVLIPKVSLSGELVEMKAMVLSRLARLQKGGGEESA